MLALLESIPVLASLIGVDDFVVVNPAYYEAVFLDDFIPLSVES